MESGGRENPDERRATEATLPAWAIRLAYRITQLEHGRAYSVLVVKAQAEPTWAVQAMGKVENGG